MVRSTHHRPWRTWLLDGRLPALLGAAWALAALVTMVVVFDDPTRAPQHSPDEAAAEHATRLVRDHFRPAEPIPFDDPSGLAHPRLWVRAGGTLVPAYPPATFYLYGVPAMAPGGAWLRFLLPAAGLGSLVAGIALLLPDLRRWLAATVPALAFPALYWALRPWHNMSTVVALAGIGVLGVALRVRRRQPRWLLLTLGAMTLAASVRPDQVHLLLGLSLLAALGTAADSRERWRWLAAHVAAGAVTVGFVLATNRLTTGSWMTTPVDLLDFPAEVSPVGRSLPFPFSQLVLVFAPRGWPDWGNVATQLGKYWVGFGAAPAVLATAVAGTVAGWRRAAAPRSRAALLAGTAALVLLALFTITRVSPTDWGAAASEGALHHTLPRYTALAYLGVGIAAVAAVASLRHRAAAGAASIGLVVAAVLGLRLVYGGGQPHESLGWLRGQLDQASQLAAATSEVVPEDAILWLARGDKFLWEVAPVGLLQHERPTTPARVAVERLVPGLVVAHEAGYESWLFELTDVEAREVAETLRDHGLVLEPTGFVPPPVPGFAHEPTWRVVARE